MIAIGELAWTTCETMLWGRPSATTRVLKWGGGVDNTRGGGGLIIGGGGAGSEGEPVGGGGQQESRKNEQCAPKRGKYHVVEAIMVQVGRWRHGHIASACGQKCGTLNSG